MATSLYRNVQSVTRLWEDADRRIPRRFCWMRRSERVAVSACIRMPAGFDQSSPLCWSVNPWMVTLGAVTVMMVPVELPSMRVVSLFSP